MEIEIKKLGINGEGIGYYQKKAIFVQGALPGENVEVEVITDNQKYSIATIVKIIKKSEKRVNPFCPYYLECGGCSIQHLDYEESLRLKREMVIESITKYTKLNPYSFEIKKMIGANVTKNYRNKSSLRVKGDIMGIYRVNSNFLVAIDDCPIHNEEINRVNKAIVNLMKKHHISGFDQKKNTGTIRYVVTRIATASEEIQVTLILGCSGEIKELLKDISRIPKVVSVYTDFNKQKNVVDFFGNKLRLEIGQEKITERLENFSFSLLPNAFFQLNPLQTINLYNEIKKAAKLSKKENVLDAYCGVGTIGIWLAKNAYHVLGIDSNQEAIHNAKENALLNKVNNIEFLCGDVNTVLMEKKDYIPDIIITDPPRTGLGDLIDTIIKYRSKRVIYVSCNPSTHAKDLDVLSTYYNVNYIQPIDMFPYTSHVETITLLELKKPI